jgi:alpha-L-arabinofuranosidase
MMKKTMHGGLVISLLLSVMAGWTVSGGEQAVITVSATNQGPSINPNLYGIFLEEINHGVDGGLYAELIRNRAFEDARPPEGYHFERGAWRNRQGFDSGFSRYGYTTNGVPFWKLVQNGEAKGSMHLQTFDGITEQSAYCLRLDVESNSQGRVGVANEGFFGIGAKEGQSYALSLYARGSNGFTGPLRVRLEDAAGNACSDEVQLKSIPKDWRQFEAKLTATKTDSKARLVITAGDTGTVWLDFVSLFPAKTWKNRENGLRPDIAQMIYDLQPRFVRFPGGCVVEAASTETAYDWKLTVGPLEKRSERWGPWNYRRTQGMGLLEYFQFCEDLGAEPLYVGFAGQTCIFRAAELVPMDQMGWVRDNFLDVVEYANGPAKSKWGALRAQAGRKAPFDLKLVEIGNENQGPEFGKRYRFIYDALTAKYTNLTTLADLSWTSRDSLGDAHFDIEDQHYYNSPRWFATRFDEYDGRDRKRPPLYLGEVAVTTGEAGNLRGNLLAALSEGVFLMGCEENADVVSMVSYAPLLGHVDGRTELTGAPPPWHAMIYFDGTRVFGTASYYLWKLFGANRPDHTVRTEISYPDAKPVAVTGQIGMGTWADRAEFKDVRVEQGDKVLYASDFNTNATGWNSAGGRWSVENGVYRQGRQGQGFSYFGDESWTDYTLNLKARNVGGSEGFLIVFGRKGGDRVWWNLGGWGNSQHALEHNQTMVGKGVPGKIESDRWYDIKVELSGARIRCYLDGELVHDAVLPREQTLFSVAGRDTKSGDLILKAINLKNEPVSAEWNLAGFKTLGNAGELTVLTSASLSDNNNLDQPTKVQPTTKSITIAGEKFAAELAPRSLSVMRIKAK